MVNMAILTAADWLARAEEAQALAETLTDVGARQTMLHIAQGYTRLARHSAQWTQTGVVPAQSDDD